MNNQKKKKIIITSTGSISLYGGVFGPIKTGFYETVSNIGTLLSEGCKVQEVLPNGTLVKLDMINFDKDNKMIPEKKPQVSNNPVTDQKPKHQEKTQHENQKDDKKQKPDTIVIKK